MACTVDCSDKPFAAYIFRMVFKEVRKKDFLCLHLFVYIGMGIISLFYLIHGRIYREYLLFVFFVLGIFVLYGFVFYVINRWLARKFL